VKYRFVSTPKEGKQTYVTHLLKKRYKRNPKQVRMS
jgi:hypothetical protein